MDWTASAMSAAQTQLDVATQNLASSPADGFQRTMLHESLGVTGISVRREVDTSRGALRHTGRPLDIAATGTAGIVLCTGASIRGAALERTPRMTLAAPGVGELRGQTGALRFPEGAVMTRDGAVVVGGRSVDHLELSGDGRIATGFLESANTDPARAMIDVLEAQRRFETAQKAEQSIDAVNEKNSSETARPAQ